MKMNRYEKLKHVGHPRLIDLSNSDIDGGENP